MTYVVVNVSMLNILFIIFLIVIKYIICSQIIFCVVYSSASALSDTAEQDFDFTNSMVLLATYIFL